MAAAALASSTATDTAALSDNEDAYDEYVPIAKRRAMEAERHHQFCNAKPIPSSAATTLPPPHQPDQTSAPGTGTKPSLLITAMQLNRASTELTPTEQLIQEEKDMIDHLSERKPLMSVRDIARGVVYSNPIETGWKPPLRLRRMPRAKADALRRRWHILVDNDDVPPPVRDFRDLHLLDPVLRALCDRGISQPTPIQVQGCPSRSLAVT
ncbi:hypothetical protein PR202_gb16113 [Eleusine coracana subsp. coracana]|uniref:DEAD-box RNA helicase Q domain-containing protein n=1 Tax=Eleusine coracana subsp. coracana TaxID=191504 RepID=A0AAV5EZS3_ELECO|nr:hypothetical protein PR202_gb16113 [Eleusine coracana subsp. coracana]